MSLQTRIDYFTEIRHNNSRLQKYISVLDPLYIEKSLHNKKEDSKKISNKIKATTSLFNERALETKNKLQIDVSKIGDVREREFCKVNWFIEQKKVSDSVLRFKRVQERGAEIEQESIQLNSLIYSSNNKDNKGRGSKNERKQIKRSKKRQEGLEEILKNIEVLVEIITDMKNIVNSNKDVVDSIEINIEKSEILSSEGARDLEDALVYAKRINVLKGWFFKGFVYAVGGVFFMGVLFFLPLILF